jgi:hypothetical protein
LEIVKVEMIDGSGNSVNYKNMSSDVVVTMDNGYKYIASFLTYENLYELTENNVKTGAYFSGRYFWIKNMVLVDSCNNLRPIIDHMVDQGDFQLIFEKI